MVGIVAKGVLEDVGAVVQTLAAGLQRSAGLLPHLGKEMRQS
jgi:hypothetical protein